MNNIINKFKFGSQLNRRGTGFNLQGDNQQYGSDDEIIEKPLLVSPKQVMLKRNKTGGVETVVPNNLKNALYKTKFIKSQNKFDRFKNNNT